MGIALDIRDSLLPRLHPVPLAGTVVLVPSGRDGSALLAALAVNVLAGLGLLATGGPSALAGGLRAVGHAVVGVWVLMWLAFPRLSAPPPAGTLAAAGAMGVSAAAVMLLGAFATHEGTQLLHDGLDRLATQVLGRRTAQRAAGLLRAGRGFLVEALLLLRSLRLLRIGGRGWARVRAQAWVKESHRRAVVVFRPWLALSKESRAARLDAGLLITHSPEFPWNAPRAVALVFGPDVPVGPAGYSPLPTSGSSMSRCRSSRCQSR